MVKGGGGSWKLDNFQGRHMSAIPNTRKFLLGMLEKQVDNAFLMPISQFLRA